MKHKNILAIIPARGGSKGVPGKNIKLLSNKPLLAYTAEAARDSKKINRVILSSDNDEVITTAKKVGIEVPYKRPSELAQDDTPSLLVVKDIISYLKKSENYIPEIIVLLQPTSPFRKGKHIDEAINLYEQNKADSLVSVVRVPHNFNPYSVMQIHKGLLKPFLKFDEKNNMRQKKPIFFGRNGAAIYVFTTKCLEKNSFYGKKTIPYIMNERDSIDIDTEWDFTLAEILMNEEENENKL